MMIGQKKMYWYRVIIIFAFGVFGVLSFLPVIPKLVALSGQELPFPISVVQLISVLQSSLYLVLMVLLGAWLSPKVNLGAPLIDAFIQRSWSSINLRHMVVTAILAGFGGGVLMIAFHLLFLPLLPPEFIEVGKQWTLPFVTRILYGGITEEILVRWGVMTFFVWGGYRMFQRNTEKVHSRYYVIGLILSAVLFGVLHLPIAFQLSPAVTVPLVIYIIIGNSIGGVIAGFLYWKRGLESAVVAHMVFHVVFVVANAFIEG